MMIEYNQEMWSDMQYDKEFKLQALELSMKSESGQHSRSCLNQGSIPGPAGLNQRFSL
jgi:hypothetical protein